MVEDFTSKRQGLEETIFNEISINTEQKKGTWKPLNKWFSGAISYTTSLNNLRRKKVQSETVNLTGLITPRSYWFLGFTYRNYINGYSNESYQPDFSYSFGYNDWHQDTFSLVYSNYANNKISPKGDEDRFNFDQGTWDLGYKTKLEDTFLGDLNARAHAYYTASSKAQRVAFFASKTIDEVLYSASYSHQLDNSKKILSFSAKKVLYKKFFASGTLYHHFDHDLQEDWESDYAYSFGWLDTRAFKLSVVYSNYYMKNRYPHRDEKGVDFMDGNITVSMNIKF